MTFLVVLLVVLLLLTLLILGGLLFLMVKEVRALSETRKTEIESFNSVTKKALALLSSKTPMEYQAIQVMENPSLAIPLPSDEEDVDKLLERFQRGEGLTDEQYKRIDDANFGPGVKQ